MAAVALTELESKLTSILKRLFGNVNDIQVFRKELIQNLEVFGYLLLRMLFRVYFMGNIDKVLMVRKVHRLAFLYRQRSLLNELAQALYVFFCFVDTR